MPHKRKDPVPSGKGTCILLPSVHGLEKFLRTWHISANSGVDSWKADMERPHGIWDACQMQKWGAILLTLVFIVVTLCGWICRKPHNEVKCTLFLFTILKLPSISLFLQYSGESFISFFPEYSHNTQSISKIKTKKTNCHNWIQEGILAMSIWLQVWEVCGGFAVLSRGSTVFYLGFLLL